MEAKDTVLKNEDTVYIAQNGTPYTVAILKSQCVSNANPKWVNENIDLIRKAQLAKAHQHYEREKAEAVRGALDYVESMFPELESTYWQGKNWKRFRKE